MSSALTRRLIYATAASFSAGAAFYISKPSTPSKKMLPTYEATFSVPLNCDACVEDISSALSKLPGIHSTTFSLPSSMLTTTGTTPPSAIISTIQSTGRPAILRGSGAANSAAVCILETPPSTSPSPSSATSASSQHSPVRGLIRLIQLSQPASPPLTLLDLTLTCLAPGCYTATVRASGDVSRGAASMGDVFRGFEGGREGILGRVEVGKEGRGELVGEVGWGVWEVVGRGVVVAREDGGGRVVEGGIEAGREEGMRDDKGGDKVVVGVVARSAGVWENEKVVCGCSGKTVWEERGEAVKRGML